MLETRGLGALAFELRRPAEVPLERSVRAHRSKRTDGVLWRRSGELVGYRAPERIAKNDCYNDVEHGVS